MVGPGVKFLVDPGDLTRRRIDERVADRLRARRLLEKIAEAVRLEARHCIDGTLLLRRQPRGRERIGKRQREVEMDGR